MISQFVSSSPVSGSVLRAQSLEPSSDSVSPRLSAPPLLMLCVCLSIINKCLKKNFFLMQRGILFVSGFIFCFSVFRNACLYLLSHSGTYKALKCSDCKVKLDNTELERASSRIANLRLQGNIKASRSVALTLYLSSWKVFIFKIQESMKDNVKVARNPVSFPSPHPVLLLPDLRGAPHPHPQ